MKKPVLAAIISAAAVCAVCAAVFIIRSRSTGTVNAGGKDTPYPYTWTENGNGSITIDFSDDSREGYSWTAENIGDSILTISEPKHKKTSLFSNKTLTEFTLTPASKGISSLNFVYGQSGDSPKPVFLFKITATVSSGLVLSFTDANGSELAGGGDIKLETDTSCAWTGSTDGMLTLDLTSRSGKQYNWNTDYDSSLFSLSYRLISESEQAIEIKPASENESKSEGKLVITGSTDSGSMPAVTYTFDLRLNSSGVVLVGASSGKETAQKPISEEEEANKKEASAVLGKELKLPDGAMGQKWGILDEEKKCVYVSYYIGESKRTLAASSLMNKSEMCARVPEGAKVSEISGKNGAAVTLYKNNGLVDAVWSQGGLVFLLENYNASDSDMLAAAEKISGLNGG